MLEVNGDHSRAEMWGNFLGIVLSRQSLVRSHSSKGPEEKATTKNLLVWETLTMVILASPGSLDWSDLMCFTFPVRMLTWASSFLTMPAWLPVTEVWEKVMMVEAGLAEVHSRPWTGAECTAMSLSTQPVLTLTTWR